MAVVYHWKHGWIPLDHTAALSKAKGNHTLAAKMLEDAHHSRGITSRKDVAKAVRDLPNVSRSEHGSAMTQLRQAAEHHNSTDLLPGTKSYDPKVGPSDEEKLRNAAVMHGVSSPQFTKMLEKRLGRKPTADDIVRARHRYGNPLNRAPGAGR